MSRHLENIGLALRDAREAREMSAAEVASLFGWDPRRVRRAESTEGGAHLGTICALLDYYGLTVQVVRS